jgi:hypothetical protein
MHKIYLRQSFMHSWEPTECLGIQILTIKLLLVISIVFGFFGTPCTVRELPKIVDKRLCGVEIFLTARLALHLVSHSEMVIQILINNS